MLSRALSITLSLAVTGCFATVPSFKWNEQERSAHGVQLLQIKFPDQGPDDYALLKEYNPIPHSLELSYDQDEVDHCIYQGYLKNEKDVYVTVTGCPGSGRNEIQFRSNRLEGFMFSLDNGNVTTLRTPHEEGNRDIALPHPNSDGEDEEPNYDRNVPSSGLIMRMAVYYDYNFEQRFRSGSVNKLRAVIAHAQTIYNWKSSLTTTIQLNVVKLVRLTSYKWSATSAALSSLSRLYSVDRSINANVYMCSDEDRRGTVGIAYFRTICHSNTRYRSSVNEYYRTEMSSGYILAHELGHNLGMGHDFCSSNPNCVRRDSRGNSCTAVGGVMDYRRASRWSTCSVEDMNSYYNSVVRSSGSYCLATNTGGPPPPPPPPGPPPPPPPPPSCSNRSPWCIFVPKNSWLCRYNFVKSDCRKSCRQC